MPTANGTFGRAAKYRDEAYAASQLARRRGDCVEGCGRCCGPTMRCIFLLPRSRCLIYDRRPPNCKSFPLDEEDLDAAHCPGYWFVGTDGTDPGAPRWATPTALQAHLAAERQ